MVVNNCWGAWGWAHVWRCLECLPLFTLCFKLPLWAPWRGWWVGGECTFKDNCYRCLCTASVLVHMCTVRKKRPLLYLVSDYCRAPFPPWSWDKMSELQRQTSLPAAVTCGCWSVEQRSPRGVKIQLQHTSHSPSLYPWVLGHPWPLADEQTLNSQLR